MSTNNELKQEKARETLGMPDNLSTEEDIDYIAGFLKAAEMIENSVKTVRIERKGQLLFTFKVHALSEQDMSDARKMATTFMRNPRGKKLPPIEKEFNSALANSCIIYLATVDEDKKRLWDNQKLKEKLDVIGTGYELIDKVLLPGEKSAVIDVIDDLCGYSGDDELDSDEADNDIDIAKN